MFNHLVTNNRLETLIAKGNRLSDVMDAKAQVGVSSLAFKNSGG
jgi:hypothetical protein